MYEENYQALANAIIKQAVLDFRGAYKRKQRSPDDVKAERDIREITKFFCSDYFEGLTDLDGPMLLKQIIEKMDENYGKK
jgi:hypothetical protein